MKAVGGPNESLSALAASTLDEVGGDRMAAVALLGERLKNDPVGRVIIDKALNLAATNAIARLIAYRRSKIMQIACADRGAFEANAAERAQADRVVILANVRLSSYPLPSGKPLGSATRMELEHAAELLRRRALTIDVRADWLASIAQRLPPDRTVLEVLSEDDLEQAAQSTIGRRAELAMLRSGEPTRALPSRADARPVSAADQNTRDPKGESAATLGSGRQP